MNKELYTAVMNAMNHMGIEASYADKENGIIMIPFPLNEEIALLNVVVDVGRDGILVFARSPIKPDTEDQQARAAMAEFICRANYGLKSGNFDFDPGSGELHYKVFLNTTGMVPSTEAIGVSIVCPLMMFKRYIRGIRGVIFEGMDSEEAVKKCEEDDFIAKMRKVVDEMEDDHVDLESCEERCRLVS